MNPEQTPRSGQKDFASQQGEIYLAAMGAQTAELASTGWTRARIALHGLAAAVHQKLSDRAGKRMERMEHKEALYRDLGNLSTSPDLARTISPTASGQPAMPRNFVERWVDRRSDKKAHELAWAITDAYHTKKIFGPKEDLDFTGSNDQDRRHQKRIIRGLYKDGRLSASELRTFTTRVEAQPPKLGEDLHKESSRGLARAHKRAERIADQPTSSKWQRSRRRSRAVGAIQKHHVRAENHLQARAKLMAKRATRH